MMPELPEHTFAKIQEHTPECAEMLVYISQSDEKPIQTEHGACTFTDDDFTILIIACKLYSDFKANA